ncbi:hypothetical protein ACQ4PT_065073 [Festuca glaucescens]
MADRTVASGDDRISALPLDVRLRLLSMLPVEEAVRSSELSREWRGFWKKMPSLRLVGLEQFETAEGFNEFVNHLIVLRGHLPLDNFEIEVRQSEAAVSYPYANLWIHYQSVLLNGLSNAIHLELIADSKVYVYRRDLACCPIFGNLKTLLLNGCCVAHGLHGLVCILQHSPILEKLTLLFYNTKGLPSAIEDDGNHDPIEQTFACPCLKVVNIKCQVSNERVSKTLKLLRTCGIYCKLTIEHIRLKVNWSRPYSFSFEMPRDATPSTSDHDAVPSSTADD